jgi:4-amino-4-deoxy-L-arabinose transferase-like glycosyltransferase
MGSPKVPFLARSALTPSKVALGLLVFAVVWLSVLALTCSSPPSDNVEQLAWVRSLEWGYYKHPPLPTWLLWLPVQVFGLSAEITYVMGAMMVLGSFAILWRLLSRLRGPAFADIALLCGLCIGYYNRHLFYYNHNVVLMLLSVASAALLWQAYTSRHLRWWIALGVTIGLGALSKYQIAVTVLSGLAFLLHQRACRDPSHRLGLLCATLTAVLIFVPHMEWLRDHDFGPISYAVDTSLGAGLSAAARAKGALGWLVEQLFFRGGLAFALLAGVAWKLRRSSSVIQAASAPRDVPLRDPATALILAWGLLPLCFMPLVGIFLGSNIRGHWGTPFVIFAVPAVMEMAPRGFWDKASWRKVIPFFLLIQALLLAQEYVDWRRGPVPYSKHNRNHFDATAYAKLVADPARAQLGGPIRVISGPANPANILAAQLAEKPLVIIDGRLDRSPWIAPGLVARCGAVELGFIESVDPAQHAGTRPSPPEVSYARVPIALAGARPVGPTLPGLSWRVRMPEPGAAPCELD